MGGEDKDSVEKVSEEVAKIILEKGITGECEEMLVRAFGERGKRALRLVALKRVKKYVLHPSKRVRWIIVGRNEEYLVFPSVRYCSCKDFFFYVMTGEAYACYHLLAQRIAELSGLFSEIRESDDIYEKVIASRIFIG